MRYEMRKDGDKWCVWDAEAKGPVIIDERLQVGMSLEDADDLTDLLNGLEAERVAKGEH